MPSAGCGTPSSGVLAQSLTASEEFSLPARGESVAEARRMTRLRLDRWGVPEEARETAALVVSELFTNAVVHTDSESVVWRLRRDPGPEGDGEVYVEVGGRHRQGEAVGASRTRLPGEEHGRGLLLVEAVSTAWGIRDCREDGWSVWARLPLTAEGDRG
ncbi:ATP-binding protein [Streptomyces sp. YIM 98790]|uniref:ATP-binding protein n=1 Tax=Streptomyces sp. YIM 98790 TaxID=2689077 RepID=UPI00140D9580|nr:ATP-binding protein [Streptomyces sp. YIM 98790]